MGADWRPGNVQPFPSRGPFGGRWNRYALHKCRGCGKALKTVDAVRCADCEKAQRKWVKREKKRQEKKEAQRESSGKPTKAEWKKLKNLTMAEWQQEKKEQTEQAQ